MYILMSKWIAIVNVIVKYDIGKWYSRWIIYRTY